jgi:hypothetical protein
MEDYSYMTKRITACILICLVVPLGIPKVAKCDTNLDRETRRHERIKDQVFKLGAGPNTDVEVILGNKQKLRGNIIEVSESDFKIMDKTKDTVTTVTYPQVQKVKVHRWSGKTKAIVGIALIVGIVIAVAVALPE